jgi:hypothetical protein
MATKKATKKTTTKKAAPAKAKAPKKAAPKAAPKKAPETYALEITIDDAVQVWRFATASARDAAHCALDTRSRTTALRRVLRPMCFDTCDGSRAVSFVSAVAKK